MYPLTSSSRNLFFQISSATFTSRSSSHERVGRVGLQSFVLHGCSLGPAELIFAFRIHCIQISYLASSTALFFYTSQASSNSHTYNTVYCYFSAVFKGKLL